MGHLAGIESDMIIEASDPSWWEFVSVHREANIFHHPAWSELMIQCYGYRSFVIAWRQPDGSVGAALPFLEVNSPITGRRWVSLPFTDHCQPIYQDSDCLERLAQSLLLLSSNPRVPRIELRGDLNSLPGKQALPKFVLHDISLDKNIPTVFSRVHSMHQRNIRAAETNGIKIVWGDTPKHLDMFYDLHLLCRKRQGVPIQPRRFFRLLGKHLIDTGLGFLLLAFKDDHCIAGAIFLHWQTTLTYKYGASCSLGQKYRANNLIMWQAIQWGCENDFTVIDLGRTDISNEGLRAYKSRWGARECPLYYTNLTRQADSSGDGRLMDMMHTVIRRSPPWVCRVTGELLYRHFG